LRRTIAIVWLLVGATLRLSLLQRLPFGDRDGGRLRRAWRAEGRRMRRAAERYGGLLVKLGQFLSTRADVLPREFTQELGRLRDVVPPAPWEEVEPLLRRAYGGEFEAFFPSVEREPRASASLAQVHFATLADGRPCALKILRPGIAEVVRRDLDATHVAAEILQRFTPVGDTADIRAIWREFAEVTLQEIDLIGEMRRAVRFRRAFRDDPHVGAPKVFRHLTRPGVLVMERVGGVKPDDVESLRGIGVSPRLVARRLTDSYMKQWLVDGFFHADPHPGNIFVQPGGRLVYVDFGMMAEVRPDDRRALRKLVLGVALRDGQAMAEAIEELGFLRPGADRQRLRRSLVLLTETLVAHGSGRQKEIEAQRFVREVQEFLFEGPFQIPARYTFLGRAFGILAGLVAVLDPDENFTELLVRSAEKYAYEDGELMPEALRQLVQRFTRPVRQALRVLDELDNGTLRLPVDASDLREELRRLARGQRRTVWAMLTAVSALTAATVAADPASLRDALLALSGVFFLLTLAA
jgi:predicted unusual protein kinase regulating ubiquinone biosynthesis (AarF/ABC1/UbiB family)